MVCCCIFGCSNNSNRNKGVGFYLVPKVITWQCSKTYNLSSERRSLWLKRINRQNFNEKTIEGSRVCGIHFARGKPTTLFDNNNVDWAPSLALGYEEDEELEYKHGRWVKCKKRKLINITTVTSTSATQSGDFIMLDGVDCESETINVLKFRKNKNLDELNTASSSSKIKNKNYMNKEKINYLKKEEIDSNFKDVSCQTDIKCEYIGHLETHVVHLRNEVKNLKQQIEQYEAYYQMLNIDETNDADHDRNNTLKCDGSEVEEAPQSKKYKFAMQSDTNQSLRNESINTCSDDDHILSEKDDDEEDYASLIPQVVIKEEPEDSSDKDGMSYYDNIKVEEVMIKQELNESQSYDSQSSCDQGESEHLVDMQNHTSELNDNTNDNHTHNQLRKSSRRRKCSQKLLCDDTQVIIESAASNTKNPRHTGYSLWSKERRAKIIKSGPDMDFSAINKLLSETWKKVSKSEKNTWQTRAKCVNNGIIKTRKEMKAMMNSDGCKMFESSSQ